jgi:hypothetical protein
MPVNFTAPGIQSHSATLLESLDYEKKLEEAVMVAANSGFGHAEAFNPTVDWNLKGGGDTPALAAVGIAAAVLNITGVTDGGGTNICKSLKRNETNTNFNGWDASGTYYPNA